jgi:peroxiredoxin Q/BCP
VTIGIGDRAPDFELAGTEARSYRLSDYRGKVVVVVFYPGDNTPVCTRQLNSYNDELAQFRGVGAQVLAISAQDTASHDDFAHRHGFGFPLLADTDKEVAKQWGVLGPLGFMRRSVFIVDGEGIIRYVHRALAGVTYRPVDVLIDAVRQIGT